MSKRDELRNLKYQRSADAPINIHGRTGESSDVGSMLDLYAHSESPEEIIFARDDVKARERFQKGFDVYLERVFDEREREFLRELLHGERTAAKVGAAFGVNHFEFLQSIQRKAYENTKPLIKLARLSGWEGAAGFIRDILQRLRQLQNGAQINDVIPGNQKILELRTRKRILLQAWRKLNIEHYKAYSRVYMKIWRKKHREKLRARSRQYYWDNRERELARNKKRRQNSEYLTREHARALAYRREHREELCEKKREYFSRNREEINAKHRAYYEANKERIKVERNTPEKREKRLMYMREYNRTHREKEREYRRKRYEKIKKRKQEMARCWRERNLEKVREQNRRRQARYRAKKKEK